MLDHAAKTRARRGPQALQKLFRHVPRPREAQALANAVTMRASM